VQIVLHVPQWFGSLLSGASQPSEATVLQSPKPGVQVATVQLPAVHAAVALGSEHMLVQVPQCRASLARS
jgi:hypothetical protein